MPIRSIIAVLVALAAISMPAQAVEKPYRVFLEGDAYQGGGWLTGLHVELEDGWKTYWHMPGEAGIPPQFTWKPSVPVGIEVLYPLPARFADASGETVGYKHEVVFPVRVKAGAATDVTVDLDLFFAVCRDICIPAQAKASITLGAAQRDPQGSRRVEEWLARVPKAGTPVSKASIVMEQDSPVLHLDLTMPASDIFVETAGSAYFRKPVFSADGRQARLVIDNVRDASKLKGATLKLTVSTQAGGLEQDVTLP
jgi:DsbC/DsbD-like thiol-disulfide interchange protein